MGTVTVLDASVVIGLLDDTDVHHSRAVEAVDELGGADFRLPASAYAEVLTRPARAGVLDQVRRDLQDFGLRVDALQPDAAEAAAKLRARHRSLRLPDALILGHAEAIGADAVLTTDRRWQAISPRVRVVG